MTKSMFQEVNLDMQTSNGCSIPVGKDVKSLVFLQASYAPMNLLMEAYSLGQKTRANKE